MIDHKILPYIKRMLNKPAEFAIAKGLNADQVTLIGFGFGLAALPAIITHHYFLGFWLMLTNRILDGLDGIMARKLGTTDRGAFLDITLDFLFYSLVPLAFAFADPKANALAAAVLITSFVGTGTSFLAFSLIADRRGIKSEDYPTKGIYYLGGLTEGFETGMLFILFSFFPQHFAIFAYIFAGLCAISTYLRVLQGWRIFGTNKT